MTETVKEDVTIEARALLQKLVDECGMTYPMLRNLRMAERVLIDALQKASTK